MRSGTAGRRAMPPGRTPLWAVYLGAVVLLWVANTGRLHLEDLLLSLAVGAATLPVTYRPLDLGRRVHLLRILRQVLGFAVAMVVLFLPDAVLSTWDMTRRIVRPKIPLAPGIVAIPIDFGSSIDTLLLSNHLTLTPGQFVVDFDFERGLLYLHAIDARDPERIRAEVQRLHRRARRIVGL